MANRWFVMCYQAFPDLNLTKTPYEGMILEKFPSRLKLLLQTGHVVKANEGACSSKPYRPKKRNWPIREYLKNVDMP